MISGTVGTLPLLHDPRKNERVVIERLGRWQVLGTDRRSSAYLAHFYGSNTPVQILLAPLRINSVLPLISILTPCRATGGKFEFLVGRAAPVRLCCYACVRRKLDALKIASPDARDWIVYMIMESVGYMEGPAPKERSRERL